MSGDPLLKYGPLPRGPSRNRWRGPESRLAAGVPPDTECRSGRPRRGRHVDRQVSASNSAPTCNSGVLYNRNNPLTSSVPSPGPRLRRTQTSRDPEYAVPDSFPHPAPGVSSVPGPSPLRLPVESTCGSGEPCRRLRTGLERTPSS